MKQIRSEMAGTVVEVKISVGDLVDIGQEVAVVESMKMEVPLMSQVKGKIASVLKTAGDFLNDGEPIAELADE